MQLFLNICARAPRNRCAVDIKKRACYNKTEYEKITYTFRGFRLLDADFFYRNVRSSRGAFRFVIRDFVVRSDYRFGLGGGGAGLGKYSFRLSSNQPSVRGSLQDDNDNKAFARSVLYRKLRAVRNGGVRFNYFPVFHARRNSSGGTVHDDDLRHNNGYVRLRYLLHAVQGKDLEARLFRNGGAVRVPVFLRFRLRGQYSVLHKGKERLAYAERKRLI